MTITEMGKTIWKPNNNKKKIDKLRMNNQKI